MCHTTYAEFNVSACASLKGAVFIHFIQIPHLLPATPSARLHFFLSCLVGQGVNFREGMEMLSTQPLGSSPEKNQMKTVVLMCEMFVEKVEFCS